MPVIWNSQLNQVRLRLLRNNTGGAPPTSLAHYTYQLGAAGNRLGVTEREGRTVNYGYDNLHRLTAEAIANDPQVNGTINYAHDHVGNRLSRTLVGATPQLREKVPPTTSSYNQSQNDWLDGDTYDANGNTTASAGNTDVYDFEDHLISRNNGQVQFVYDGDGNRVQKTAGGVDTHYLIEDHNPTGYPQVIEEWPSSIQYPGDPAAPSHEYAYGLSRISENHGNNPRVISYYGYDGHGSVRFLTDESGTITDTYTYDAFGILIAKTGTTENNYLYAGEQFDSDLGLYYNRARYLSIATGRFWTMDTIMGNPENPLSINAYLYADADPVNKRDPSGNTTLGELTTYTALVVIIATEFYYTTASVYRQLFAPVYKVDVYFRPPSPARRTAEVFQTRVLRKASAIERQFGALVPTKINNSTLPAGRLPGYDKTSRTYTIEVEYNDIVENNGGSGTGWIQIGDRHFAENLLNVAPEGATENEYEFVSANLLMHEMVHVLENRAWFRNFPQHETRGLMQGKPFSLENFNWTRASRGLIPFSASTVSKLKTGLGTRP